MPGAPADPPPDGAHPSGVAPAGAAPSHAGGAPGAPPAALEAALGYVFKRPTLLRTALTHRSYLHDAQESVPSNERLEFLGDAVLGFLVARRLYQRYPDKPEGELTSLRGALVRLSQLTAWGSALDLGRYLYLSKGDDSLGGRSRPSIVGRAMEALLGAIYLDGGLRAVDAVLGRLLATTSETEIAATLTANYKGELQRVAQARWHGPPPSYRLVAATGPAHAQEFTTEAWIGERLVGQGTGRTKQQAEQAAARAGLDALDQIPDDAAAAPAPAPADEV
jgi:ribonuclease III